MASIYLGNVLRNLRISTKGEPEICKFNNKRYDCGVLKHLAYVTVDGYKFTHLEMAKQILLLTSGNGLEMVDMHKVDKLNSAIFYVSSTDHYLRSHFEKIIARLEFSRMHEEILKMHFESGYSNDLLNTGISADSHYKKSISIYYAWKQQGCFISYSKEKCNLHIDTNQEVAIKIADLVAVWVLFAALLSVSNSVCVHEFTKLGKTI